MPSETSWARTASSCLAVLAVVAGGLILQGCAAKPAPVAAQGATVYAVDLAGAAKNCKVATDVVFSNSEATVPMTIGNDGGWCAITLAQPGPKPYAFGLLVNRPAHGHVFVHTVGDRTRIDYTPDHAFAGADSFSVKLTPGNEVVRTTVTVGPA